MISTPFEGALHSALQFTDASAQIIVAGVIRHVIWCITNPAGLINPQSQFRMYVSVAVPNSADLKSFQGLAVDRSRDCNFIHRLKPADGFLSFRTHDTIDGAASCELITAVSPYR